LKSSLTEPTKLRRLSKADRKKMRESMHSSSNAISDTSVVTVDMAGSIQAVAYEESKRDLTLTSELKIAYKGENDTKEPEGRVTPSKRPLEETTRSAHSLLQMCSRSVSPA